MRRLSLIPLASLLLLASGSTTASGGGPADGGGPIVLMGIDAEDGGPGDHGPIGVYVDVVNTILSRADKAGTGILVIGGGKDPSDEVTEFWDEIATQTGVPVTYVNTAGAISAADFSAFEMLGVVSDENETPDGGLTQEEHDALAGRQADIASFINIGGGLLGFSSNFDPDAGADPFAYMGGVGGFTIRIDLGYNDITPTPEGQAVGITDDLDVDAWHNTFIQFPTFLDVLATQADSGEEGFGEAAAVGGQDVFVGCREFPDAQGNLIVGTEGDDSIVGTKGDDVICGLAGNDTIRGLFGNDLIAGGAGNDTIQAGHGNDQVLGGAGNDTLRGIRGRDVLKGQAGKDRLFGGRSNDKLNGGKQSDRCKGGAGRDQVRACER